MNQAEAKAHIERLRREIEEHNNRYYVLNQPIISDFEFDLLMNELQTLEKKYPEFSSFLANHKGWQRYCKGVSSA